MRRKKGQGKKEGGKSNKRKVRDGPPPDFVSRLRRCCCFMTSSLYAKARCERVSTHVKRAAESNDTAIVVMYVSISASVPTYMYRVANK